MVFKCSVPGCRSGYKRDGNILPIFKFPSDPILRQQWVQNIGRSNLDGSEWQPTINHRVCAKHFRESDFKLSNIDERRRANFLPPPRRRVCLKPFAIPRIFPDRPSTNIKREFEISRSADITGEPDCDASSSAVDFSSSERVVHPGLDLSTSSGDNCGESDASGVSHSTSSRSMLRTWTERRLSEPHRARSPSSNDTMGVPITASLSSRSERKPSGRTRPEANQPEPSSSSSVGYVSPTITSP